MEQAAWTARLSASSPTLAYTPIVVICLCPNALCTKQRSKEDPRRDQFPPAESMSTGGICAGTSGQAFLTFAACGPFGPWVTSYDT